MKGHVPAVFICRSAQPRPPVSGKAAAPAPVAPPSSCAPDSSETNAPIAAGDQSAPLDSERKKKKKHKEALNGSLTNQGQIYNYVKLPFGVK